MRKHTNVRFNLKHFFFLNTDGFFGSICTDVLFLFCVSKKKKKRLLCVCVCVWEFLV